MGDLIRTAFLLTSLIRFYPLQDFPFDHVQFRNHTIGQRRRFVVFKDILHLFLCPLFQSFPPLFVPEEVLLFKILGGGIMEMLFVLELFDLHQKDIKAETVCRQPIALTAPLQDY